jgi:hypothetical protein
MPGQNTSQNDVEPHDLLLDFDSEEPDPAVKRNVPDAFHRKQPDIAVDGKEPDIAFDRGEPRIAFDRKEPGFASERNEPDIQPQAAVLPGPGPSVTPVVTHESLLAGLKTGRRNIGVALLVLGIIGLVWSGRLLMRTLGDAGASAAPTQDSSRPTPDVPQAAPNVLPPAPAPQPPARTDASSAAATPSGGSAVTATATRPDERSAGKAPPRPVVGNPNAPGGLFAITRPVGAQVFLDDMLVGTTPLFMSRLLPGSHQVRLELPGFKTYSSTIEVEPNERFRLALQLEELTR